MGEIISIDKLPKFINYINEEEIEDSFSKSSDIINIGEYIKELRELIFPNQGSSGCYVGRTRPTIVKYEKAKIPTPFWYYCCIAYTIVHELAQPHQIESFKEHFLSEIEVIRKKADEFNTLDPELLKNFKRLGLVSWESIEEVAVSTIKMSIDEAIEKAKSATEETSTPDVPLYPPLQRPRKAQYFTGREAELKEILNDLKPGVIVTLTGSGGVGKSALAAEAIWTLASSNTPPKQFPDGIIRHDFYKDPQVDVALEKIARIFGEKPRPTPATAAERALAGRQALLVLDGVENADDLEVMLAVRDQCGLLVISRQRKDVTDYNYWHNLSTLPTDEAKILLQSWGGKWAADEAAARQICKLVGGLPLAIRLAGSFMVRTEEYAAEYLEWLEETPLVALDHGERQRESVPVLLKKSIEQVSKAAQQALAGVGLLASAPFGREVIAASMKLTRGEVVGLLGELVNYSLLERVNKRYMVTHALVHTYARRRMTSTAEMIKQLETYYIKLVEELNKQEPLDYDILDAERTHIMTLLTRYGDGEHSEIALRLSLAMDKYLNYQGHWAERITAMEIALTISRQLGHPYQESEALGNLGVTYRAQGQVEKAIEYHQQALVISQKIGDLQNEGIDLGNLGLAYRDLGQVEKAIEYHQQALVIAQKIGDLQGMGEALNDLGNDYRYLGQVEKALEYYQQSLVIAQTIGNSRGESEVLSNLGSSHRALGQVEKAIEHHQQAVVISQKIGDLQNEGSILGSIGADYHTLGQVEKASEYYQQSLAISHIIGDLQNEGLVLYNLGIAYHDLGQVEKAIEHFLQGLAILEKIGSPVANQARFALDKLLHRGTL